MADEVRKLAVESSNSIQQVKQIVKTILGLMQDSVEKMDNGRRAVEEGWATISAAVKAFTQIAENIGTTVAQVGEVSSLTQTMAGGAQQIAAATEEQSAAMYEISFLLKSWPGRRRNYRKISAISRSKKKEEEEKGEE